MIEHIQFRMLTLEMFEQEVVRREGSFSFGKLGTSKGISDAWLKEVWSSKTIEPELEHRSDVFPPSDFTRFLTRKHWFDFVKTSEIQMLEIQHLENRSSSPRLTSQCWQSWRRWEMPQWCRSPTIYPDRRGDGLFKWLIWRHFIIVYHQCKTLDKLGILKNQVYLAECARCNWWVSGGLHIRSIFKHFSRGTCSARANHFCFFQLWEELFPEKRFLVDSSLHKVSGSMALEGQVRRLKPHVHIFGSPGGKGFKTDGTAGIFHREVQLIIPNSQMFIFHV